MAALCVDPKTDKQPKSAYRMTSLANSPTTSNGSGIILKPNPLQQVLSGQNYWRRRGPTLFLIQLEIEWLWLPDQWMSFAEAGLVGLGNFPFPQETFPRGDFP